ncbi:hypothetical protein MMC18_000617 [Xylographa bjoerkii]|nr:hypothetical protein [Xylographa bjoerkii]
MSHPNVEALDRMVLLLSNKLGENRLFVEVLDGSPANAFRATVAPKRVNEGWFDQAWYAQQTSRSPKDGTAYTLRNVRSGTYLQAGNKLADGSAELEMATIVPGPKGKIQSWYITNDGGFARIKNAKTGQVFELSETEDKKDARVVLRDNDFTNKEEQTWKYERVSRSADDIAAAMKASHHMPNEAIEYQQTDATYLNLPPEVRRQIWESTGLGSGNLVWRNQIFDCEIHGWRNAFAEAHVSTIRSH